MPASSGPFSETSSGHELVYHENPVYAKNSRAIGVLWAVFTLCFTIINVVIFVQPQWLGDTASSPGTGYFGLWRSCRLLQDGQDLICEGRLDDFSTIQTPAFRAATVFVALSVVLSALAVLAIVLFFFMPSSSVFHVCGWLQLSCAMSMLMGVLIFPIGWDTPSVREVCGTESDSYAPGQCSIRWAFILAIIGVVDCIVLSILAFVLGTRYVKELPDQYLKKDATGYKGEVNCAFSPAEYMASTKKHALAHLQPQLMPPNSKGAHHQHMTIHSNSFLMPFVPPNASTATGIAGGDHFSDYSSKSNFKQSSSSRTKSHQNLTTALPANHLHHNPQTASNMSSTGSSSSGSGSGTHQSSSHAFF